MKSGFSFFSHSFSISIAIALLATACTSNNQKSDDSVKDSVNTTATQPAFHADNDIAMIILSMVDAIKVGEKLDSMRYNNKEQVLTDGQGTPLYMDIQDAPGAWNIKIISPQHAIISNLYLGDLTPEFLQQYITSTLKLDSTMIVKDRLETDDESRLVVYDFSGGYIGFDSKQTKAKNGKDGPLMHIIISADETDISR